MTRRNPLIQIKLGFNINILTCISLFSIGKLVTCIDNMLVTPEKTSDIKRRFQYSIS